MLNNICFYHFPERSCKKLQEKNLTGTKKWPFYQRLYFYFESQAKLRRIRSQHQLQRPGPFPCELVITRAVNRVRLIFRSCGPALAGSTSPLFQNASQNYSVLFWDIAERSMKGSKPNLSALLLHQAHYKKSANCTHSAIACPTAWKINNSPEN